MGILITQRNKVEVEAKSDKRFTVTQLRIQNSTTAINVNDESQLKTRSNNIYIDRNYGYSFEYGDNIEIKNRTNELCTSRNCESYDQVKLISIDNLYLEAFKTNENIDYDFGKGVQSKDYKKPQKVLVGGKEMYYIINNDGYIQAIVADYKYVEDKLWFKDEVYIFEKEYYITFSNGKSSNVLPDYKIYLYNTILEKFRF